MIECLYTSDKAIQIKQKLYKKFSKENKTKKINDELFYQFCQNVITNFKRPVIKYDKKKNILKFNLSQQEKNKFLFNENKQYNFENIENVLYELSVNGKITNIDQLKNNLNNKFNIEININQYNDTLLNLLTHNYFHHFWHLSRVSSLDIYYKLINFIHELPQDEINLNNILAYNSLFKLMQDIIPNLFILIGEIDLLDSESSLPILIKNNQFNKDLPSQYYERILHYSNNEHWIVSNSLTEMNDYLNYINNSNKSMQYNDFTKIFKLEFLNNPKIGLSKFYCKKYKQSDLMLIKIMDKEYQMEFINQKDNFNTLHEGIIDYAN